MGVAKKVIDYLELMDTYKYKIICGFAVFTLHVTEIFGYYPALAPFHPSFGGGPSTAAGGRGNAGYSGVA